MGSAVVVVGAGPAGATAAMRLHRAGIPVVLLDRARFPRDKICGDLLPPRTFPVLQQAGFRPSWDPVLRRSALLARGSVVFERLAQQRSQAWRSTQAGALSLTPIAEALPRRLFDALLVEQLREQGLPVREGWQLTELSPDPAGAGWCLAGRCSDAAGASRRWQLQTRWVLAADGAGSRVRQLMLGSHARADLAVGVRVLAKAADAEAPSELVYPQRRSLLYRWSFQLGEQCNQGLFRPLAAADAGAPAARLARQWFGRSGVAWACPLLPPPERLVGSPAPGVLLLGDAASLVDPLLGHGIDHAAESGLLAADCVLQSAAVADGSRAYDTELKGLFGPRWQQLQAVIQRQLS